MKKKVVIISLVILIIIVALILFIVNRKDTSNTDKFYLDDEYYNTEGKFMGINDTELETLIDDEKSFVVFTYLPYCTFSVPCDQIFASFMEKYGVSFYEITYDDFAKTSSIETVKYAPSVIIYKDGKIVSYLDANEDDDLSKYEDEETFENWMKEYISIK